MEALKVLEGKKTYLAAAILVVLAVAGYLSGYVSEVNAVAIGAAGFGLFGLGDKSERHFRLMLALLQDVKRKQEGGPG